MDDTTQKGSHAEDAAPASLADKFVGTVGMILKNNKLHYWLSPHDAEEAVDKCFVTLGKLLSGIEELTIHCGKDALSVNEALVDEQTPHVPFLIDHLNDRDIHEFCFESAVTLEQFRQFMSLLETSPEGLEEKGTFADLVRDAGLDTVRVRIVVYKEVAEDDVVLSARKLGVDKDRVQTVENVLAFLKGDVGTPSPETLRQVDEIASDTRKLVELIMKAADVRQRPANLDDGESLASIVVGSLRRVMQKVLDMPSSKTKKGRKRMARTLVMLEREMLETLRTMAGEADLDTASAVSESFREMRDEIEMESLAEDYMKKRRDMELTEERVLRHIRDRGLEGAVDGELKRRLTDGGLDAAGFQELLSRSGARSLSSAPGMPGSEFNALERVAMLLSRLENIVSRSGKELEKSDSAKVLETAVSVQQAVADATADTARKINQLADSIEEDRKEEKAVASGKKEGREQKTPRMPRQRMLEILAEVVQELCQPLSVINCALQMMRSGKLGTVNESQTAMMTLAQESADRIKMLTDSLRRISGEPDTLSPDLAITTAFYAQ